VEWWDPETGKVTAFNPEKALTLEPYESRILLCADSSSVKLTPTPGTGRSLSKAILDWSVTFPGSASSRPAPAMEHTGARTLWTDSDAAKFYSGEARYTTHFSLPDLQPGDHVRLGFPSLKTLPDPHPKSGMSALVDPPIREAAIVELNGKTVGSLWHPPYSIDLTAAMKPGDNTLTVRVFNTAINALAGQRPRDYSALKAKYGDRFQMQDMENLKPVPSGIQGNAEIEYGAEDFLW
jgi:hypothetical protein